MQAGPDGFLFVPTIDRRNKIICDHRAGLSFGALLASARTPPVIYMLCVGRLLHGPPDETWHGGARPAGS